MNLNEEKQMTVLEKCFYAPDTKSNAVQVADKDRST